MFCSREKPITWFAHIISLLCDDGLKSALYYTYTYIYTLYMQHCCSIKSVLRFSDCCLLKSVSVSIIKCCCRCSTMVMLVVMMHQLTEKEIHFLKKLITLIWCCSTNTIHIEKNSLHFCQMYFFILSKKSLTLVNCVYIFKPSYS